MISRTISVITIALSAAWAASDPRWEPFTVLVGAIGAYVFSEVDDYKKKNERKSDHDDISKGLVFDARLGIYFDQKSGKNFCPKCLKEGYRSHLQSTNKEWGSSCNACEKFYAGPEYEPVFLA